MEIAHKDLLNNKYKETVEPLQILYSQITIIIFIIPKLLTSLKEMLDLPNFGHMKFSWWHHGQKLWHRNVYFKMALF